MQDNSILKEIDQVLLNTQKSNKQKDKSKQNNFDIEHDKTQTIENLLNDLGLGDDNLMSK